MMPLRAIAPAGAPIGIGDLTRWAGAGLSGGDLPKMLEGAITTRFGVQHCSVTSSGRAGLTLLLRAMRRVAPAERDEVIVPSYTCYSVAAAVVRAGLRPRIVDISADTLDYSPEALAATDWSRVLAIVASSLYGLPADLPELVRVARSHGAFLIDDAAQAMGGKIAGQWCGTWGDAGLFSFDKGKSVSAVRGGAVVTNRATLAAALDAEMETLLPSGRGSASRDVGLALSSFVLLRPWLYWIPNSIPQLGLGKTVYSTEFAMERPSRALSSLGAVMMRRLDEFTATRRANADALLAGSSSVPGLQTISPLRESEPVYLRLPLLAVDGDARARAVAALVAAGIGASASYPASIADIPALRGLLATPVEASVGRDVASRIFTLPTHAYVSARDIERTVAILTRQLQVAA